MPNCSDRSEVFFSLFVKRPFFPYYVVGDYKLTFYQQSTVLVTSKLHAKWDKNKNKHRSYTLKCYANFGLSVGQRRNFLFRSLSTGHVIIYCALYRYVWWFTHLLWVADPYGSKSFPFRVIVFSEGTQKTDNVTRIPDSASLPFNLTWLRSYKTCFMLNTDEHEIFLLTNMNMPIDGIFIVINRENYFILSYV